MLRDPVVEHDLEEEVQQEYHVDLPPGTELMHDTGHIHFAKSGNTVLVPQPHNDPNDPLNWSKPWKYTLMVGTTLLSYIHQMGGLSIAPQVPFYMEEFNRSADDILLLTGVYILLMGLSTWIWIPISNRYGRRVVVLASTLLGIAVTIWRAEAKSYESSLAAAAIHGISSGPSQTLPASLIADIQFLHVRGVWMNVFACSIFISMTTGSVIAGVMSEKYGWRSFWWLDCGLYCFMLVWSIFLMPETKWTREDPRAKKSDGQTTPSTQEGDKEVVTIIEDNQKETFLVDDYLYQGKPHKRQFKLFHDETGEPWWKIWKLFWIPVKICSLPIVLWSSLVYSGNASLFLVVNLTQSSAFSVAPYNFSASAVGYTNFATLGGLIIGLFTAGHFSDWLCSWSTKRNNGIREPEQRLPALIPFAILATVATIILCVGYDNQWDWPIIVVLGYGLIGIQTSSIMGISTTYGVDCYRPITGDIFVVASIFKDVWAYGVSNFLPPMVGKRGYTTPIMIVYAVTFGPLCFGIIMYFIGKPLRRLSKNNSVHYL